MDDYDQFDSDFHEFNEMAYNYGPPPLLTRNDRYNNAFGNYRGGYGPGGDYGPPPFAPPPMGPRFRPGPPGPPPLMGQGFGPRGPPRHMPRNEKAYRYLLRCGVPKDSLKNVPNDLYNLVTPQYCGLCGMDLPDFNISRVHYGSKNHLKSQKKWLSKRTDGPQRVKEAPLKSRELYCELCDVQITSKAHAESHYLGKPHRAIVEGRKVPKNPILLQRNMSQRLDQLIRREKKCLKNVEEKQPVAETPKAEDSKLDPELYCDICKTSVTCSEQMTMHLNGKKHLAREKRHIFDMMQGKPEETDSIEDGIESTFHDDDNGEEQQTGGETATDQSAANEEPWTEAWNDNNSNVQ